MHSATDVPSTSIARQVGSYLTGPGVNSSRDTTSPAKTLFPQPGGHLQAAHSMVTKHQDFLIAMGIQFIHTTGQLTHRQQGRIIHMDQIVLILLSAIEQQTGKAL